MSRYEKTSNALESLYKTLERIDRELSRLLCTGKWGTRAQIKLLEQRKQLGGNIPRIQDGHPTSNYPLTSIHAIIQLANIFTDEALANYRRTSEEQRAENKVYARNIIAALRIEEKKAGKPWYTLAEWNEKEDKHLIGHCEQRFRLAES